MRNIGVRDRGESRASSNAAAAAAAATGTNQLQCGPPLATARHANKFGRRCGIRACARSLRQESHRKAAAETVDWKDLAREALAVSRAHARQSRRRKSALQELARREAHGRDRHAVHVAETNDLDVCSGGAANMLRVALWAAVVLSAHAAECSLAVTDLRVDGLSRIYAASARPLLSWRLSRAVSFPPSTVVEQSAYRLVASTLFDGVASGVYDAWDSGWIISSATLGIAYGGDGLATPGDEVWWSVFVRDGRGVESTVAPAAMALVLAPGGAGDPWHGALWITANATMQSSDCECYDPRVNAVPLLRGTFSYSSASPVISAHLFLAGLGMYEAFVSGSRVGVAAGRDALLPPNATAFGVSPGGPGAAVGDEVLAPPWTSFGRRVHFAAHNVSTLLTSAGRQSIALALGRGWWDPYPMRLFGAFNLREALTIGRPQAIALLVLRFADGSTQRVVTAPSDADGVTWRTASGPLTRNNIYIGEGFESDADAAAEPGLAIAGWTRGTYNDSAWRNVAEADAYRTGELELNPAPPIRIVAAYAPERVERGGAPGSWVVSFPKNIAGWMSIAELPKSDEPGPTAINLTFAELFNTSSNDIDPTTNIACVRCAGHVFMCVRATFQLAYDVFLRSSSVPLAAAGLATGRA